jgi:chemotaxis protein MotB
VDGSNRGGDEVSGSEESKSHELVIIRRRTNDDEAKHHGGVWKIAYADFMTAMMAFFLVMWLINSTDKKTLTQVATYFNPLRLTDKRPSPKGLEEPDGNEGKDSTAEKGAKKADGETKGKKKADGAQSGEVRSRGQPFQRELEDQEQKHPADVGASPGESPRQAGGRAYRDPFDSVHRSEIVPSEPSNAKVVRATPPGVAPRAAEPERTTPPLEAPRAADPGRTTPPVTAPSVADIGREAPTEAKTTAPSKQLSKEGNDRADAAQLEAAIKQAVSDSLPGIVPNIDVVATPDGVLISLTDDYEFGMFAIASAEPRPAMIVVMDKVAKILLARSEPLVIRGHTDRRPYRTATYDNWRLSAARAHMAYVMLARSGVDEKRFERIEGHADRSLRVAQDPEAAQNRRIEILLRKGKP